jgi:hypothetical protein
LDGLLVEVFPQSLFVPYLPLPSSGCGVSGVMVRKVRHRVVVPLPQYMYYA